jgi:hypothetical protein
VDGVVFSNTDRDGQFVLSCLLFLEITYLSSSQVLPGFSSQEY